MSDAAETLYTPPVTPAPEFESAMTGQALAALKDGNIEKADAIEATRKALTADFEKAGSGGREIGEVMGIVNAYAYSLPNAETRDQQHVSAMEALSSDWGDHLNANLTIAKRLIRDLDAAAPGLINTLELTGAGNDARLIQAAYREARRRGYR
jgi:hypothetical protein